LNICHLIGLFVPDILGGHITYAIDFGNHMNRYCRRQFFIVAKSDSDTSKLDSSFNFTVYRGTYLKHLPLSILRTLSFGLFSLKQILLLNKKYDIDIIISHILSLGIIATIAGKLLHKPVVWHVAGTFGSTSRLGDAYETIVAKIFRPDHVFAGIGSIELKKFTCLLGEDKVTAIHGGVDTERFCPKLTNKQLLKNRGLENSFIIVSAHRLVQWKGVEYGILAFNKFLQTSSSQDAVFIVIGDGILRHHLEMLASDLGINRRVVFLGEIDNSQIPDYLSIADIVVATSIIDNNNCSTREAMACGKPVIAFDCQATKELIQHMETGILAESGNISDLANKMLVMYESPELLAEIGRNARESIVQNYSWNSVIYSYAQVCHKLIQQK